MLVIGDPCLDNSNNSSDDDVEDDTYIPSPRAHPHGNGLASASGSGTSRDEEIGEEDDDADGEGEEEINPPNYVHMWTPIFRQPLNPDWKAKVRYKGKIELLREKRKANP
jgi:hypothetical protein